MAGGFTKYNKLEVTDLGTEGTGDRIALFNSDGRLIGYVLKESLENLVPLSGTEVGKPITGDLRFNVDGDDGYSIGKDVWLTGALGVNYEDSASWSSLTSFGFGYYDKVSELNSAISSGSSQFSLSSAISGFKGLVGSIVFDKQNDPNAFAQLGDIATTNATVTPLSLSDLNTAYELQGNGFKVICPTLNLIYIKSSLTTWESIVTTTVV